MPFQMPYKSIPAKHIQNLGAGGCPLGGTKFFHIYGNCRQQRRIYLLQLSGALPASLHSETEPLRWHCSPSTCTIEGYSSRYRCVCFMLICCKAVFIISTSLSASYSTRITVMLEGIFSFFFGSSLLPKQWEVFFLSHALYSYLIRRKLLLCN